MSHLGSHEKGKSKVLASFRFRVREQNAIHTIASITAGPQNLLVGADVPVYQELEATDAPGMSVYESLIEEQYSVTFKTSLVGLPLERKKGFLPASAHSGRVVAGRDR